MFKSLYARLALGLVLIVALLSGLYLLVTLQAGRLYSQELNQQFNRELAANLIRETGIEVRNDRFDREALKSIFHAYMVINPSIEVYLLNRDGRILAYSAPPDRVRLDAVSLGPVKQFLRTGDRLPIVGDDPRHPTAHKVFSAAPIGLPASPQGYLYIVLAGEKLDSVAAMLQGSYILQLALAALLVAALAGLLGGLWLLRRVTRRLQRLDRAMTRFEESDLEDFAPPPDLDTSPDDELGRLGRTFSRMAERITQQVGALKHTDALRRELVANVSHDLRTPIASLQGYLETLLMKEPALSETERRQYLAIALRHSERLGRLVGELFELAKLDSEPVELNCEPFSPGELVQDVVMKYQLGARRQNVRLRANIPADLPYVKADIGLIERVLDNLLENAIRHTPADGEVLIELRASNDKVRIGIADTGCGIPAEELPHVFDRFYQINKNERDTNGTAGLGLAIAKRILDLHASTIHVDSAPERGTRFDFSLRASA